MRTRIIGYMLAMVVALLCQGAANFTLAQDNSDSVNRLAFLRGLEPTSNASGFVKLYYKAGKTPFQRFQVAATGLKPDTDYQLFVNGIPFDIKRSSSAGAIEFLFSSGNKNSATEGALELPSEVSSVLSIENISLRERDLAVALIGQIEQPPAAQTPGQQTQILSLLNSLTMEGGKTVSLLVPISDPNGDPVTLSVSCDRGNFITVSGMSLVMAPTDADVGNHICTARVTDSFGLFTQIPFVVSVTPANKPPAMLPIADQIVKTGEVKDVILQASDPDGNVGLRFIVSQGPAFVILSDRGDGSGILRIAPQPTDTQGGVVTVRVIDAGGLTAQTSFTVTVQRSVVISAVTRSKPNLFISGSGFNPSGAIVSINGVNVSGRIVGQSDSSITLRGGGAKLNLKKGPNQITVSSGGTTSNTFILNMLEE